MIFGMKKLAYIPFADDNGNATPLSFLLAARESASGASPSSAVVYINAAISALQNGYSLNSVCIDNCELAVADSVFKQTSSKREAISENNSDKESR